VFRVALRGVDGGGGSHIISPQLYRMLDPTQVYTFTIEPDRMRRKAAPHVYNRTMDQMVPVFGSTIVAVERDGEVIYEEEEANHALESTSQ